MDLVKEFLVSVAKEKEKMQILFKKSFLMIMEIK